MLSSAYGIRRATTDDLDAIMRLLADLTAWLAELGTDQWQNTHERRRALVAADIADGRVWAVLDHGGLVATMSVDDMADADFWTPADTPSSALYVHRMAVARSHAGRRIGSAMLNWASALAELRGKDRLRFDAWSTNSDLHQHYKSLDFAMLRNVSVDGRESGALFERPARDRTEGPRLVPITADLSPWEAATATPSAERLGGSYVRAMDLAGFAEMGRTENGLVSVATARADGSIQASVVNAGVLAHPVTGTEVVGFVANGRAKLANLRARPRTTVTVRSGWRWATVEGAVELAGPGDALPDWSPERADEDLPPLLRAIFTAAGGTHDDWPEFDATMAREHRVAVLVAPERVYGV